MRKGVRRALDVAGKAREVYVVAEGLGLVSALREWWSSRPRVIARRARWRKRREGKRQ